MRKNLLTLMLGFLFLSAATVVAKAEVSNPASLTPAKAPESIGERKLALLEPKLSFLNSACALVSADCDNALLAANVAYSLAVVTCNAQGWGSAGCTSAVGVAEAAANTAASKCAAAEQPLQANNIRKNFRLISPNGNRSERIAAA